MSMARFDLLRSLAAAHLPTIPEDVALARVLRSFSEGRELERHEFDALVGAEFGSRSQKDLFLDFILYCVRHALSDHRLSEPELALIRYLKRLFRVEEGELLERRQEQVAGLLQLELERILEDRQVDAAEALHKVELQALFDLGYDEFTELIRPAVYEVLLHLVGQLDVRQDGTIPDDELSWYQRQLLALDTIVELGVADESQGVAPGYLYLLVNPSMEGIVKIGRTTRNPAVRAEELGAVTGVPTPFLLVFDLFFPDCDHAERYVHDVLEARGLRVSEGREFFRVSPSEAIQVMLDAKNALPAV